MTPKLNLIYVRILQKVSSDCVVATFPPLTSSPSLKLTHWILIWSLSFDLFYNKVMNSGFLLFCVSNHVFGIYYEKCESHLKKSPSSHAKESVSGKFGERFGSRGRIKFSMSEPNCSNLPKSYGIRFLQLHVSFIFISHTELHMVNSWSFSDIYLVSKIIIKGMVSKGWSFSKFTWHILHIHLRL